MKETTKKELGTTLVEVIIVAVLTASVLGIFYDGVHAVNTMTVKNSAEMKSHARQADVLEMIRKELEQSGMDTRFTVAADGLSISYTKLIGAVRTGADVSGIWSQTFTIGRTADGEVRRIEGGRAVSWGRGVKSLTFNHNPADNHITVACVTEQDSKDVSRSIFIYPNN